ncbi:unnamed protein product [Rotaria magnacalcarata]|uniref:Uncharacterized protein n=1 Tax=Rotaria magnacalcarata TaxID=392030 RepID=A0A814TYP7_9BILA|nr:unnamed protein product [Rotaria magnacalcarata]
MNTRILCSFNGNLRELCSLQYTFGLIVSGNDNVHVGSCPRLLTHIENELIETLDVTAAIDFQAVEDIERNRQGILSGPCVL